MGMASGVTTLAGQAYGAGHHQLVGVVTQRAMLISVLMTCLIILLWTQLGPIMVILGEKLGVMAMRHDRM